MPPPETEVDPEHLLQDTKEQRMERTIKMMIRDRRDVQCGFFWHQGRKFRVIDGLQVLTLESPRSNMEEVQRSIYDEATQFRKSISTRSYFRPPILGVTYHHSYYRWESQRYMRRNGIKYDRWTGWQTGFHLATEENKTTWQIEAMQLAELLRQDPRFKYQAPHPVLRSNFEVVPQNVPASFIQIGMVLRLSLQDVGIVSLMHI